MKDLIVSDATKDAEEFFPLSAYVNIYLRQSQHHPSEYKRFIGSGHVDINSARLNRNGVRGGITIRISRTVDGDFKIEKVEEF